MNKTVLITGASGFIGQHVVRNLLSRPGLDIVATTRDLEKARQLDFFEKIRFVQCDLSVPEENWFKILGSPDLMIHLAWDGLPRYKELFHIEKVFPENFKFIKSMVSGGLKNLTVAGTCFEYGMVDGKLDETMPANPNNAYGIAKDTLRKSLEVLRVGTDLNMKWLRLFYMYGPGQAQNSLISQIERAVITGEKTFNMSGGEQVRDYLAIEEVADYFVECSLQSDITGIINCCSGKPVKVKDFVRNYLDKKMYNLNLNLGFYPYPDYEPMSFWGDNTKLSKVIGHGKI